MTDVAPCGCLAAKFDSCNSLLSSVHTLLVNILWGVRLYIKRNHHHQSSINHQSSVISHQSSVISHQSSVISHQSSVISHQSSVISHQSSVIIIIIIII